MKKKASCIGVRQNDSIYKKVQKQAKLNNVAFRDTTYIHDKKIITTQFRMVVSYGGEGGYDCGGAHRRFLEWKT